MIATRRVTRIYERHVKSLPIEERLDLLALVAQSLAEQAGSSAERPSRNIMNLHGLGKDIWERVDAPEHVKRLRDEWERSA